MTQGRATTVMARTGSPEDLRASTQPPALEGAAETFRGQAIAAVAHASTTTGYLIGPQAELALEQRLSDRFHVPAVTSCTAAASALRVHGCQCVQLVHPPWFGPEFDSLGAAYFQSQGFEVMVTRAVGLPDDPARVTPKHVIGWVLHHVEDSADGVFLAGNGFRAAAAVEELERRTGRLVLAANQALLRGVLAATGVALAVPGHGQALRRIASSAPEAGPA